MKSRDQRLALSSSGTEIIEDNLHKSTVTLFALLHAEKIFFYLTLSVKAERLDGINKRSVRYDAENEPFSVVHGGHCVRQLNQ
jgi:hypothetical protein